MYKATLVNTNGSFTLGTPDGTFVFKPDNISNIVPETVKDYLAEQIDMHNKPLFVFEKVEDIPQDTEDNTEEGDTEETAGESPSDKPSGKKTIKKAVQ